jgi:hypothetical protein
MTLEDFVMNFRTLFVCKVFNDEYQEVVLRGEWNCILGTAGGSSS